MTEPRFDVTPSPRVLRMLGQIDFKPWQCLAELIDNALDAIMSAPDSPHRQVAISLPTLDQLVAGTGSISVRDSGPGMGPEQLELSVKAGYSGNDPVEKLGLFGMGFNIATARLGRRTEVWSIAEGAENWVGVTLDFDEMEAKDTFLVDRHLRPRGALEAGHHGTIVTITKLDADRVRQLVQGRGKGHTKQKLGRIYSRIIEEQGVSILYGTDEIEPRRHCIWSPDRTAEVHPFGLVPSVIPIDENLGDGRYCTTCWVWLSEQDETCASCGTLDHVSSRPRRVKGWIGLQRFFDMEHYGIDLIRNGRVIEELDKSLFFWAGEETDNPEKEYPIDAMYVGGRFVGELEIDFVRVSHQKDAFDKHDPGWQRVVEVVRGAGPIRPKVAEQHGYPRNTSPLARLFAAFRQTSPAGIRNLIPADSTGRGMFQEARRWADEFWRGVPEYQTDEKWYEAALQAEKARRQPISTAAVEDAAGSMPGADESEVSPGPTENGDLEPAESILTEPDPALTQLFELPGMPGAPSLSIKAARVVAGKLPGDLAAALEVRGNSATFTYRPTHKHFVEGLDTPREYVVREVAYQLLLRSGERQAVWPLTRVEYELRLRYFKDAFVGVAALGARAATLLDGLRQHLVQALPELAPIGKESLTAREMDDLRSALAAAGGGEAMLDEVLARGTVAAYLGRDFLIRSVRVWPELVLDGRFLAMDYTDVLPEKRELVITQASSLLADVLWLSEQANLVPSTAIPVWREQLARASAGLGLLEEWRSVG